MHKKMNQIALTLSALGAAGLVAANASADATLAASRVAAIEVEHAVELGDKDDTDKGGKDDKKKAPPPKKKEGKKGGKKAGSCGAKGGCGAGTCG